MVNPKGTVVTKLRWLGVPPKLMRAGRSGNSSFWRRQINHLAVLEKAKERYRARIAKIHPDKPGGSTGQTVILNTVWSQIQRLFKQQGHTLALFALLISVGCKTSDNRAIVIPPLPATKVLTLSKPATSALPPFPTVPVVLTERMVAARTAMVSAASVAPASQVRLEFTAKADPAVTGYRIYYGGQSGKYTNSVSAGMNLSTPISGLTPGATYYFAAVAFNSTGIESAFSNEATYAVPLATTTYAALSLDKTVYIYLCAVNGTLQSCTNLSPVSVTITNRLGVITNVIVQTPTNFYNVRPIAAGERFAQTNNLPQEFYRVSVP